MTKEEKQRINNSRRRLWRGESEIVYITESVGRMVGVGALDHLSPAPMVPSAARNEDHSMFSGEPFSCRCERLPWCLIQCLGSCNIRPKLAMIGDCDNFGF